MICYTFVDSPLGRLLLRAQGGELTGLFMETREDSLPAGGWTRDDQAPPFPAARDQLADYFAGERRVFDLPLAPTGTPFQVEVWRVLLTITYGETISYGELARRVGRPRGAQAVGAANGRNPISIIVPCHRVIGADGALVGYGGGLQRKAMLLAHEAAHRVGVARQLSLGGI